MDMIGIVMWLNKYIKSIKERDPAMKSSLQILLFNNSVKVMFWYRIAHFLYIRKFKYLAFYIMNKVKKDYATYIKSTHTVRTVLLPNLPGKLN